MKIRAQVEMLTPERARQLLRVNGHNRKISDSRVRRFAHDMANGYWHLNGQGIVLSESGELLDGQHRMLAVILAGVSVPMLVVQGVDTESFRTMDSGEGRKFKDTLAVDRYANPEMLAAAVRLLHSYEIGTPHAISGFLNPTNSQLAETVEKHPDLGESCAFIQERIAPKGATARRVLPPATGVVLHYLLRRRDRAVADDFMHRLLTGIDLSSTSPIYRLRERLLEKRSDFRSLRQRDRAALVIKVWNIVQSGREMPEILYLRPKRGKSQRGAEAFPAIA